MKVCRVPWQVAVVMLLVCTHDLHAGRRNARQVSNWFGNPRDGNERFPAYEDITPGIRPIGGYDAEYSTVGALIGRGPRLTSTTVGRTRPIPQVIFGAPTKKRRCLLYNSHGLCLYLSQY
ncbi:uncharacterized protein LOC122265132 [Penaeus japonicus]|uniref:uncharacterized protein LOC122265132 n=1 Tax=Penaeus japonicus TaxID=27405 RepID=UPI001C70E8B9|nr:uncharacterized protein LOC122265132 [Penaeus japonicus]